MPARAATDAWAPGCDARNLRRRRSGPERLRHIQRGRIIAALAAVVAERGASGTTVEQIAKRSGVSRRTFYESFRDVEDCLLAAFDEGVASIAGEVVVAYEQAADERARHGRLERGDQGRADSGPSPPGKRPGDGAPAVRESWGSRPALIERRRGVLDQLYAAVDGAAMQSAARSRARLRQSASSARCCRWSHAHPRLRAQRRQTGRAARADETR